MLPAPPQQMLLFCVNTQALLDRHSNSLQGESKGQMSLKASTVVGGCELAIYCICLLSVMQGLGNHTILAWNVLCCVSIVGTYMTRTVASLHLDNIVQTFCTLWLVTYTRQTPVCCVCDCTWVSERSHSICHKSTLGKLSTAVRDRALG